MAEKEQEPKAEQEAPAAKAAGGKSHLMPIAGGVIVFVIFVVIFSFKFGVFSSSNVKTPPAGQEQTANADSAKHQGEEGAEEATEAEADPYHELFAGFDGTTEEVEGVPDTLTVRDSVQKVAWFEEKEKELDRRQTEIDVETTKLNQLKAEIEVLLNRKKAMEDGNMISMAKLYEGMNTEQLVPILSNLDDAQVSALISRMKKAKASEVLGQMPPERAAKITKHILSMTD